jgi:DNA-binding beta-propeller fold protein YncE
VAHPQIAVFARLAKGTDAPQRVIFGQASKLSRTMHAIRYNATRDEFYVGNPFAQAVLTFRGAANGQESPIRTIQGPKTMLDTPDTLEVDPVHEELFVPEDDKVLVFPVAANGDAAPLRVLRSPAQGGWRAAGGIAVDPIHNVLVLAGTVLGEKNKGGYSSPYGDRREALLIFDRQASGAVQPIRVIRGSRTGMHAIRQIEIQPKGGWIVISQMTAGDIPEPEGTYIGVYSIFDSGNVPPRWKIDGKPSTGMKKPHGIALNPNHKEVVVADMRLNAILTFYFPEIF